MSRHPKTLTRSFAGGEMSPEMFSRRDDIKYQAGAEMSALVQAAVIAAAVTVALVWGLGTLLRKVLTDG